MTGAISLLSLIPCYYGGNNCTVLVLILKLNFNGKVVLDFLSLKYYFRFCLMVFDKKHTTHCFYNAFTMRVCLLIWA